MTFVPAHDDLDVLGIVHSVTNMWRQIDVLGAHTIVWSDRHDKLTG